MPVSVLLLSGLRKGKLLVSVLLSKVLTTDAPLSLDRLQMHDRLSRNELLYMKLYYRGHWQPLCAYVGLVGCTLLVLFSGWVPIYILAARGKFGGYNDLKGNTALIAQVLGAYSGVRPTGYVMLRIDWQGNLAGHILHSLYQLQMYPSYQHSTSSNSQRRGLSATRVRMGQF